eukprot:13059845-Alexandrium_andersonii.AAC.1
MPPFNEFARMCLLVVHSLLVGPPLPLRATPLRLALSCARVAQRRAPAESSTASNAKQVWWIRSASNGGPTPPRFIRVLSQWPFSGRRAKGECAQAGRLGLSLAAPRCGYATASPHGTALMYCKGRNLGACLNVGATWF